MLFDEIFAGMTLSAGTSADPAVPAAAGPSARRLDNVDLSGFVQIDVKRGSELSASYNKLGF